MRAREPTLGDTRRYGRSLNRAWARASDGAGEAGGRAGSAQGQAGTAHLEWPDRVRSEPCRPARAPTPSAARVRPADWRNAGLRSTSLSVSGAPPTPSCAGRPPNQDPHRAVLCPAPPDLSGLRESTLVDHAVSVVRNEKPDRADCADRAARQPTLRQRARPIRGAQRRGATLPRLTWRPSIQTRGRGPASPRVARPPRPRRPRRPRRSPATRTRQPARSIRGAQHGVATLAQLTWRPSGQTRSRV